MARLFAFGLAVAFALFVSGCRRESEEPRKSADGVVTMGMFPAPSQTSFLDYPVDGVRLGQGWHREGVTRAVATCIEFTAGKDSGQEQSMKLSVVNDSSALMDALDVSAEAQFKSIGYEVSGKARFARDSAVRSSNLNVLAYARVMNGVEYVAPAESGTPRRVDLTPHYRGLARDALAFEQECGDSFVAAVYSGAELAALLTFSESDRKLRSEIEAQLSGSVGGFSGEAKGRTTQESASTAGKLHVTFHQAGGSGGPMPTTQAGFIAALERLPDLAAKAPYNYRIQVQSYRTLPSFTADVEEDRDRFRRALATSYGRLETLRHAVVEALSPRGQKYVDFHRDQNALRARLQALHDELMTSMNRLRDVSRRCTYYDEDMSSSESDRPCELATEPDFRNDYEYRLRLPVLVTSEVKPDDPSSVRSAIIEQHVRAVSRRRCDRDPEDPGCLLERQIEELSTKLAG
jgi:hypothetical protein